MALKTGRVVRLMVSPFLHPKTGVFYFRQAVPIALRASVGAVMGKGDKPVSELKWSLGTKDAKQARLLMPAALQRAQDILEAARGNVPALMGGLLFVHAFEVLCFFRKPKTKLEAFSLHYRVWVNTSRT